MPDLFEHDDTPQPEGIGTHPLSVLHSLAPPPEKRGKHYVQPRGYAALPGTGPAGKHCRDCANYTHKGNVAGSYPKCWANRAHWTGGRGSDILARAPACSLFEEPTP